MARLKDPRYERFANLIVEGCTSVEAYDAIEGKGRSPANASRWRNNKLISARIDELRDRAARKHEVTVDSLVDELEEARTMAQGLDQPAVMIQATVAKGKLFGLFSERVRVTSEVTVTARVDLSNLTVEELRTLRGISQKILSNDTPAPAPGTIVVNNALSESSNGHRNGAAPGPA